MPSGALGGAERGTRTEHTAHPRYRIPLSVFIYTCMCHVNTAYQYGVLTQSANMSREQNRELRTPLGVAHRDRYTRSG